MKLKPNKIHLRIGLIFLPFLLLSALTGFFRANHQWFWKEDYMKVKRTLYENKLTIPSISLEEAFNKPDNYFHRKVEVEQVKLKSETGKLLYEIKIKNEHTLLMDANAGDILSPLSSKMAEKFSKSYIISDVKLKNISAIVKYKPRKQKVARSVYVLTYDDELNTEIFVDQYTGEIVEELDDNLRFGIWMVKLHDYDFWEMKRFNLSFVSLGVVAIGFTGFWLWLRKNKRRKL
jgi:hypothetical protein